MGGSFSWYAINKQIQQRNQVFIIVIDLFSKYAWVVPLKKSILDSRKRKPNKIWVDQGSEFYNSLFKQWLKENHIEMYSTYNEGKSVVAEIFIRILRNKIYKHMIAVSKNVYFDVLDDIVDEFNNTYHTAIKMKMVDVKSDSYAEYNVNYNEKNLKSKVGDHVKILEYKTIFVKRYTPNWSEEIFVISKIKNTVPWTYVISDLNDKEIVGTSYEKQLQKANQE